MSGHCNFSQLCQGKSFHEPYQWFEEWSPRSIYINVSVSLMASELDQCPRMLSLRITKIQDSNSNLFCLQVRELNVEAAKLTSSHPNAAQDIEWKRHELEEAWANLREQVSNVIN